MSIVDQIRQQIEEDIHVANTEKFMRTLTPDQKLYIAQACHEANRVYCRLNGDTSQLPWNEAPEWQRNSALAGVEGITSGKITGPSGSHDSWMAEKLRDGWRYGPVKDVEKKEHPCLLPFDQLPARQQVKDHLFMTTVATWIEIFRYVDKHERKEATKEAK